MAEEIKKRFREIDADGSGAIDAYELKCFFGDLGWKREDIVSLICAADMDCDGTINYEEFFDWAMSASDAEKQKVGLDSGAPADTNKQIRVSFSDPIAEPATKLDKFKSLHDTLPDIKDWTLERSEGIATFTHVSEKSDYGSSEKKTYKLVLEASMKFELVYTLDESGIEVLPGDRYGNRKFNWHFNITGTWSMSDGKALLVGEAVAKGEPSGDWYSSPPEESYNTAAAFECGLCVELDGQLFE